MIVSLELRAQTITGGILEFLQQPVYETKAPRTRYTITDERDAAAMRSYIRKERGSIAEPTHALWKKQGKLITPETAEMALKIGAVPAEWSDPWARMIREYVRDDIALAWVESIKIAGSRIAKNINKLQLKQFDFDSTMIAIKAWLDDQGGALIVNLTAGQMSSMAALLQSQIALGVTSPYILSQRIKPMVGLTNIEAGAVAKVISTLTEEGLSPAMVNLQSQKYAKYLHRNRAIRIAQTELSNSYNYGQYDSIKQALNTGDLPGPVEKDWMAGGPNPCDPCLGNSAAKPILLEETFPSGHQRPTAHPNCACSVGYSVRRGVDKRPSAVPTRRRPRPRLTKPRPKRGMASHMSEDEWNSVHGWGGMEAKETKQYLMNDIKAKYLKSTGKVMSDAEAEKMYKALFNFCGEEYPQLRMSQLNMEGAFKSAAEYQKWLKQADLLEDYINIAPQFSKDVRLYRGVHTQPLRGGFSTYAKEFDATADLVKKLEAGEIKVGQMHTLDATSHWSSNLETAQDWNGSIVYETKGVIKSTSAQFINPTIYTESEVMISKATQYKITNISSSEFGGYKTWRVVLEAIQ